MATLSEGLIVVKDFGLMIILPALFVYALTYALLAKTKVLGELKWANILISTVIALIFVTLMQAVKFTNKFLPVMAAGLVVVFIFILLIKFFGMDEKTLFGLEAGKSKLGVMVAVVLIGGAALYALKRAVPAAFDAIKEPFIILWLTISEPTVMSIIVLFGTMILASYFIMKDYSKKGG